MTPSAIFWPMILQVALVYAVYGMLSVRRMAAIRSGRATAGQFRKRDSEPEDSRTAYNNLVNQFELPVLFHVLGLCLYVTEGVTALSLALAWIFVLSRFVHAWVHLTGNRLRYRNPAFIVGFVVLGLGWLVFAIRLAGLG